MNDWVLVEAERLDAHTLDALFDNEIGAIRLRNFLGEDCRASIVKNILEYGMRYYENVDPPIGRLGITQFEHRGEASKRAEYFSSAVTAWAERDKIFRHGEDPLECVQQTLRDAWPEHVGIARESGGEEYFAGLVRVIDKGLLHCDWAVRDAPDWSIGNVTAQITWNYYCSFPETGGATVVFDRPWTPDSETYAIPGSYAYDPSLVEGCRSVSLEPEESDLIFFNSRNPHLIQAGGGTKQRISVSSFVGRTPERDLVLWS